MKNERGFTIVELLTSFALASVVMVFLFTVVMILKNNFVSKSVRTDLVIKQSLLSKKINTDFKNNNVIAFKSCGSKCYEFTFLDGTNKKLEVSTAGDLIKYGDYTYELNNSSYVGKINTDIKYYTVNKNNISDAILTMDIPIYNKKYPNINFGVKIIYQFNSKVYNISI